MSTQVLDPELAAFLGIAEPTTTVTVTVPEPPTAQQLPPADPLACLADISEAKPKGKRKDYPTFPDADGTAANLAGNSLRLAEAEEQKKTNNRLLGDHILPHFFRSYHGKGDFDGGSIRVESPAGPVLVICQSRVKKITSADALKPVAHIIGAERDRLFRYTFDLKIDGDEIPPAAVAPLVTELKALFIKHGATKALKQEKVFKPYPSFFTSRHVLWTPEQNLEINRTLPLVTQVKVKDIV